MRGEGGGMGEIGWDGMGEESDGMRWVDLGALGERGKGDGVGVSEIR